MISLVFSAPDRFGCPMRPLTLLLTIALLIPPPSARALESRVLSEFNATPSAWQPGPGAPVPFTSPQTPGKISFVVPADLKEDRAYLFLAMLPAIFAQVPQYLG